MRLKALQEKAETALKAMEQIRHKAWEEGRQELSAEEQSGWLAANKDFDTAKAAIEAERQLAARQADLAHLKSHDDPKPALGRGGDGLKLSARQKFNFALTAWATGGEHVSDHSLQCAQELGINTQAKSLMIPLLSQHEFDVVQSAARGAHASQARRRMHEAYASMTTGSSGHGAEAIPPGTLLANWELNMLAFGNVRMLATPIRTSTGTPYSLPYVDDTTNEVTARAENDSAGDEVKPTTGKQTWAAYSYTSDVVMITIEIDRDAVYDMESMIRTVLAERIGRGTNRLFTTGTGSGQPEGVVIGSTLGVTTASATAITDDEVTRLIHALDPAYRDNASFMLHDNIILTLRLLKDGNDRPLWESSILSGMALGLPDTLKGYPYHINQHMDSAITAGKKTALFGDFSRYYIRTVVPAGAAGGVLLMRNDSIYQFSNLAVAFAAVIWEDAKLKKTGTSPMVRLQQHA